MHDVQHILYVASQSADFNKQHRAMLATALHSMLTGGICPAEKSARSLRSAARSYHSHPGQDQGKVSASLSNIG